MKKYFGALLLLPLVLLVMAQFAAAQDTMSAVLSTPYNSRPGSQVLYFFTESELVSGTFSPISGGDAYKSYMTITNTSTDTSVLVHYQFYDAIGCTEVFDYVDILTPQDTNVIDPQALVVITGDPRGSISGGRYLLTVTAVDASKSQSVDTRAISFNYLIGQQFITNITTGSAWGGNAITRMAVNHYGASLDAGSCYTTPQDFTAYAGRYAIGDAGIVYTYPNTYTMQGCNTSLGTVVPGFLLAGVNGKLTGGHVAGTASTAETNRLLQIFRPATLIVPHFFAPSTVDATGRTVGSATAKQFGNRLSLVSLDDVYAGLDGIQFKLTYQKSILSSWFIDNYEQPYSLPTKTVSCVTEYVLSPRKPGNVYAGAGVTIGGIGQDMIGSSIYTAVENGGYMKMNVTSYGGGTMLFGWFSQSLSGASLSAGVGDLLVGLGRGDYGKLPATESVYVNSEVGVGSTAAILAPFTVLPSAVTP